MCKQSKLVLSYSKTWKMLNIVKRELKISCQFQKGETFSSTQRWGTTSFEVLLEVESNIFDKTQFKNTLKKQLWYQQTSGKSCRISCRFSIQRQSKILSNESNGLSGLIYVNGPDSLFITTPYAYKAAGTIYACMREDNILFWEEIKLWIYWNKREMNHKVLTFLKSKFVIGHIIEISELKFPSKQQRNWWQKAFSLHKLLV